ncbi:MAG: hypothetical protein ACR2RL_13330 [Gammaproteobacteria bacterium]
MERKFDYRESNELERGWLSQERRRRDFVAIPAYIPGSDWREGV